MASDLTDLHRIPDKVNKYFSTLHTITVFSFAFLQTGMNSYCFEERCSVAVFFYP